MRLARRLAAAFLAAGLVVLAAPAADPALPGAKLTPEQKQKLKNLTPEQKQKLRAKFKEKQATEAVDPAPKPTAKKPAAPKATPRPAADMVAFVDAQVAARLAADKVTASPAATDAEFLRRVTLDLTGVIPSATDAKAFLDSTAADKKAVLVDKLLADPAFGRHQADIWQAKLLPRDSDNRYVRREPFADWVAGKLNANTPWDQFTRELLTATGSPDDNPATIFFLANRSADKLADAVGTHFLGLQIGCAQCHNHPFTAWKQTDYWGLAMFFGKVQPRPPARPNQVKAGDTPFPGGVTELAGPSRVKDFFPESAKKVPPKFLGGDAPKLTAAEPYRPAMAEWLTGGESPYFAQAFVNRAWAQLFGRGLAPLDDLDPDHPATHPEVFNALTEQFRATGYDVKQLYRTLALTAAYQRTSKPTAGNASDTTLYSHMAVKVLSPEQLYDSLAAIVPMPGADKADKRPAAGPYRRPGQRDQFVQFFLAGASVPNPSEYEAGIPQALRLMNSRVIGNPKAVGAFLMPGSGMRPERVLPEMYLAVLSRRPTPAEVETLSAYHAGHGGGAAAYADVLWALVNSSEFAVVR